MFLFFSIKNKITALIPLLLISISLLNAQPVTHYQQGIRGGLTYASNCLKNTNWINSAGGTTMSAHSDLVLPAGSKIIKAYLFVEALDGDGLIGVNTPVINSIRFKSGTNAYVTLDNTSPGFISNSNVSGATINEAQFLIDVTNMVPPNGYKTNYVQGGQFNTLGNYAVADFAPSAGCDYVGWSLVVVYTNPNSPLRSISISSVNNYYSDPVLVSIPNIVVPSVGAVNAFVIATSTEGETATDGLSFGANGTLTALSDPGGGGTANPANGTIAIAPGNNVSTDGGPVIAGNYEARGPFNGYTAGNNFSNRYDCDIFDASGILPNSTTPITV